MEGRDVAVCDIPGAFMHSDLDDAEVIHVKLEGIMAEIMTTINPKLYTKYIVMERERPVLYMRLRKALYGTVQAAMLFWENLSGKLTEWGFTINAYDFCVANKIIKTKQCTIAWHVDDLKISHVDPKVVTMLIKQLDDEYGQKIVGG